MAEFINALTGTRMWVAPGREAEYLAAGHMRAPVAPAAESAAKTPSLASPATESAAKTPRPAAKKKPAGAKRGAPGKK